MVDFCIVVTKWKYVYRDRAKINIYVNEDKSLSTTYNTNNMDLDIAILMVQCGCNNIMRTCIPLKYKSRNYIKKNKSIHFKNYNYCGPYTAIIYNLLNNISPTSMIDKWCMLHDIHYYIIYKKVPKYINDADTILYNNIKKCSASINTNIILLILETKKLLKI